MGLAIMPTKCTIALRMIGLTVVMSLWPLVTWPAEEPQSQSTDTIVLSDEALKALAGDQTTATTETESVETVSPGNNLPFRFETLYSFPTRQFIYWEWLETGALSVIADLEEQIAERRDEYRRVSASGAWSEQLQRERDRIEADIARLEWEREQDLLERIALLEVKGAESAEEQARVAVLRVALALNELDEGKTKQAIKVLDGAGELLPNEPLVRALRGIALREAGRSDEARDELLSALASQPKLLLALTTLAQVCEDNLEYAKAAELWGRAQQATVKFPRGVERWAERNRDSFPQGEESLRRFFARRFQLRLRVARLRDFAHKYYQSYEKTAYKLIYDPSIGVPPLEEILAPLRTMISSYLEQGEEGVEPDKVERLFHALGQERDEQDFRRSMARIADSLETAERDVSQALGHNPRRPPVVVLYNPNVWEALVADRRTLGLFAPHGRSISVYLTPRMNPDDLKNTLYHEYAHFVTFEIVGPRDLPLWLVEGLAEHLSLESRYDRFRQDSVLARWREIWDKERVERPWFEQEQETFDAGDYYKARRAVGLLAARFGEDGLARFLEALGDGADLDEASRAAFQRGYRDLLRYLVKQLPSWTGP